MLHLRGLHPLRQARKCRPTYPTAQELSVDKVSVKSQSGPLIAQSIGDMHPKLPARATRLLLMHAKNASSNEHFEEDNCKPLHFERKTARCCIRYTRQKLSKHTA